MPNSSHLKVAIVGCGNIAGPYAKSLASYPETEFVGVSDVARDRAEALAEVHGVTVFDSLDSILEDPSIDLVVNLTVHHAHYRVSTRCLEAGKHVYSEKPMATRYSEAKALVELAERKGLRLGCSPFTFLGEAQQTAWKWLRDNKLGTVRLAYAEVNWGRIESWHPAPEAFYQVGPLYDVGVYPLTVLTTIFGPAKRVSSYGRVIYPDRVSMDGTAFQVNTPDFVTSTIELASGCLVRLTTDFYVSNKTRQTGIEFHGDLGSLHLESWHDPDTRVFHAPFGEGYSEVPLLKEAGKMQWGLGVLDMTQAILNDEEPHVTGAQAAHVVEILEAISTSIGHDASVEVTSEFKTPKPLAWSN
ncbi:MAG: Gfo/Idh/MocA family oxidoreductase [Trueperaceae bacterium]|nr:MAG: Gfo/Idh/MocA family oxidoreductase [Trueperaceae bacterium]